MEGWFFATAALLVVSGVSKLADPTPTAGALRAAGLSNRTMTVIAIAMLELIIGVVNLVGSNRWFAMAQGALYAAFGLFVTYALAKRIPVASCGCFGKPDTPPTLLHLVVNAAAMLGAFVMGIRTFDSFPSLISAQPLAGAPFVGFVALGTYCLYLLLAELPLLRPKLIGVKH